MTGTQRRGRLVLSIESVFVVLAWLVFAWWTGRGGPLLAYDSFRDIAYALGIDRGELGMDPLLVGFPAWYPPGVPAFFALVARLTGRSIPELYAAGYLWLGWLSPLLLFLLVRRAWGRSAAWLALPFVLLGSRWWLLHAAHPMASVQSLALSLAALIAWQRAREGWTWTILAGLLAGLTFWCHVLCAAIATGAMALHGAVSALMPGATPEARAARHTFLLRALAVGTLAAVVGAWPLLAQLTQSRLNEAPHHWFGPELHDPRFALHSGTPLVLLLGAIGLATSVRRWWQDGWLAAYFALGLGGSALGYAAHDLGWAVPWALPHQFQWHQQLALMIAAAVGVVRLARRFAAGAVPRRALMAALAAVSLGAALPSLRESRSYLLLLDQNWRSVIETADWMERHSPPGAVLAASPEVGYFVAGLAGRHVVALPAGHANPAADVGRMTADLNSLLHAESESTFVAVARKYGVTHLLATNDLAPSGELRRRYDGWPSLEAARMTDSTGWLYRVRAETPN